MSSNPFFKIALGKAATLLGKKGRLLLLLPKLAMKMQAVNWQGIGKADVKDKVFVVGRLLKAYAVGRYKNIPWKPVLMLTAAVLYFINPFDLIPDLVPVLGFTDDISVLIAVYAAFKMEIDKFLTWEKSQATA